LAFKFNMLRLLLVLTLFCFAASSVRSQAVTSCVGGVLPIASLWVTAVASPGTPAGLRIAIEPMSTKGRVTELHYRLVGSGDPIEFKDLCPGRYLIIVHGGDVSSCGYSANKKIALHEKETRKVKLTARWKKGAVCD